MKKEYVYGALFGVAIGDALGVPAEFKSRGFLQQNPVVDFEGFKSHHQPPGTFSDDSSLTFCLAESLCHGYDLTDIASRFIKWVNQGYWTATGQVFDIGRTTQNSIDRLKRGTRPRIAGDFEEDCNGNGSLMRILPLLFYINGKDIKTRYRIITEVSSITHVHIRSVIACFYYMEFARQIVSGISKVEIYSDLKNSVKEFLQHEKISKQEIKLFSRVLESDIHQVEESEIKSSGYVLDTLEAAIWCFMNTENYKDAVLKAVNLGEDSDTTAAVIGGLAGLYYGFDSIPEKWRKEIRRSEDIADLCEQLTRALIKHSW